MSTPLALMTASLFVAAFAVVAWHIAIVLTEKKRNEAADEIDRQQRAEFNVEPVSLVCPLQLLDAIAEVESGGRDAAIGKSGERTRYQILPSTWRRFSDRPMALADRAESRRVALEVIQEITDALKREGHMAYPYSIALRWNAGTNATAFTRSTADYALRVAAVYQRLGNNSMRRAA